MNPKSFIKKCLMIAPLLIVTIQVQAQAGPQTEVAAEISPGPPMWKVSKGEHTLWIFGILTPLQAGVNWRSEQVESIIKQSQEYIYIKSPEPKIPLNPFKLMNGLRLVLKLRNNPDGKRLEEVIPADLYSRFSQLVDLYQIPDMEKTRPYFAADSLRGYAVIANGLTEDHGVDFKIEYLISNNESIKPTPIYLGPNSLDYEFLKVSSQRLSSGASLDEIRCLEASIEIVETGIEGMHTRARAWAEGDMDSLRQDWPHADALNVCQKVLIRLDSDDSFTESYLEWLRAAENSLNTNRTTFAVLELDQLIDRDGLLEKLRAKGYTISEP